MTLQELLKSFELSDDQILKINKAVDTVIENKLIGKDDEIKSIEDELTKVQGDLDNANTELAPVKEAANKEKLAGLMPEDADPDKHEDIVKLSDIADDDDDATIKSKLAETVANKEYLKKDTTKDGQVSKTTTGSSNAPKTPSAGTGEKTQEIPQGTK